MGWICNLQVTFPLQLILFLALTDREMFCFCEASCWWLPWLETELQRENLSMEMMARQDFSRVTETGLLISKPVQLSEGDWFVGREQPCSTTHALALHASSFMDWKKIRVSRVPHERGDLNLMLSKHKGCFWQDKCKKKYSSLLGLCLILEEIKLLTPWGGKTPQNMKIYVVCCTLIKYWTSHQSGNLSGRDLCLSSSACPQMGSWNNLLDQPGAVGVKSRANTLL